MGRGSDVGADARGVGLEGEDGQVAHDLHVLAALVALGNLHLDGRRIGGVAFGSGDTRSSREPPPVGGFRWRRCGAPPSARCRGTRRAFCWSPLAKVRRRSRAPPSTRSSIWRSSGLAWVTAFLAAFAEEPVQHVARIGLGRNGLRGRAETAVIVVGLVQAFLVLLPRLGHGGQLERRKQGMGADIVGHDLVGGNGDVDAVRESASGKRPVSQVDNSSACGAPLNGEIGTPEMPFIMRH